MVRYNVLSYLVGEGFRNVLKNKKSTGASLMIMCATMLIFGLFFLIGENVNYMVKEIEAEQGMQVFMVKDATEEQIQTLGEQIKSIEAVAKATFVSKEEALNSLKVRFKDNEKLLTAYEGEKNPLKPSYVVTLTDLEKSGEVQAQINQLENVNNIEMRDKTINALINVANGIRWVSGGILVLLIIISVFIIANTIKLTVHARRKEISIMKYVGATNNFIRWPFIVEGMIIGIIASIFSIIIVGGTYSIIASQAVNADFLQKINLSLLNFREMTTLIIFVYLLLGIGIGAIGSVISMRKYLKV